MFLAHVHSFKCLEVNRITRKVCIYEVPCSTAFVQFIFATVPVGSFTLLAPLQAQCYHKSGRPARLSPSSSPCPYPRVRLFALSSRHMPVPCTQRASLCESVVGPAGSLLSSVWHAPTLHSHATPASQPRRSPPQIASADCSSRSVTQLGLELDPRRFRCSVGARGCSDPK